MIRPLLLLTWAFSLALAQPPRLTTPEEVARVEVIRRALPAVVKVTGILRDPQTGNEGPTNGSGFFYAPSRIITNYHVVQDLRDITVELFDGRSFPAQIFAVDKGIDIAILSVQGVTAPAQLTFGSSQNLSVGMGLVVIGSPFGQRNLASYGILAGVGPTSAEKNDLDPEVGSEIGDLLFTDARIVQGNSGGPVLDLQGRVVGVANATLGDLSGMGGIGVAIPADLVRQSVSDLERFGVPQRGNLGVTLRNLDELDPLLLGRVGLLSTRGAMIEKVEPGGPAARAGLRPAERDARGRLVSLGDIILAINGRAVRNASEVTQAIARFRPGDRVNLTIWRNGRRLEVAVTMIARR
ncbi:Periplasmic pH-dependent serine endoprotease DegQ [Meiothermus luteus]|jgi:S1-C subfamily serine protease|uniref:Periplasmic pH-dependent serine endoprotease DegQ n=1 Tax=Meiothermus luteus TaxID=2026184 RepID=A0A399EW55_9DEIN|nr:trypsin-like peptidase domain-containing protein [Meiothermus luteus]RIH87913.1 Periplasmic pH-dependent serine endoprotease DegQ [Meiothermus luteus]